MTFMRLERPMAATNEIRSAGVTWHDWGLTRRSINPLSELNAMRSLDYIYRRIGPDLVHHFTVKLCCMERRSLGCGRFQPL